MKEISVKQMPKYDVIVVGGGVAGVAAAVASARKGAKTLLMEKTVILGGLATIGLINWYEPLCDGAGTQMITGISEELLHLSAKYGFNTLPERWGGDGRFPNKCGRYATHYSPNIFALGLIEYLEENGVFLRLDTLATYPDVEDGECKGILVETVGGREYFPAKVIVDAKGDACICDRAGLPTEIGDNYLSYITHELTLDGAKEIIDAGNFAKARQWQWYGCDMNGEGQEEGKKTVQVTSADDVTKHMVWGCKKVMECLKKENRYTRDIMTIPAMPQFRKIRRLIGEAEFYGTEDDVVIENSVGIFGDFRKRGRHFQLPYTTLYNRKIVNLFAAGRIISAAGEGWEITRVIPVAALSGQASGTAAALCAKEVCKNYELDINLLQKELDIAGVKIEF